LSEQGHITATALTGERALLRFYLRSADRAPFAPSYERLFQSARRQHLAGATILKGIMGFGRRGVLKKSAWSLTEQLPVIVEIVDDFERLTNFLSHAMDQQIFDGLVTLERAAVAMYRGHNHPSLSLEVAGPVTPLSTLRGIQPRKDMTINDQGVLLRVFIGEADQYQNKPLFEAILHKARELGLAGATVLRGIEGFGAKSVVHRAALLEMSTDLPIVIEIVDTQENVKKLLPILETMVGEGMITMEYVMILMYRHGGEAPTAPQA